ncbi:unnamed protein product [Lactuca saligna]|uniref:Uncharacterized protein n=1 Tax=Lactuca saligna TaxID=75948 RepID=A0AA35Z7A3_LACSI|nr:unnamed protein product [Lactuca saligna]
MFQVHLSIAECYKDEEWHPDDVEVFVDDKEDDGRVDVGEEAWSEGDDEGVVTVDNDVMDEGQVEAGIKVVVERVDEGKNEDDGVNNLQNQCTKHTYRERKHSERIPKLKLKKTVYEKDGSDSSATKPVKLD